MYRGGTTLTLLTGSTAWSPLKIREDGANSSIEIQYQQHFLLPIEPLNALDKIRVRPHIAIIHDWLQSRNRLIGLPAEQPYCEVNKSNNKLSIVRDLYSSEVEQVSVH